MKNLLAFGDANVDLITEIPHFCPEGISSTKAEAQLSGGGTVANTATGTAKLGINTYFIGKLGNDKFGSFLLDEFKKSGIFTDYLLVDKNEFTIMVLAFIDSAGEKHNVTFPKTGGAYFNIKYAEIDSKIWKNASWLHCSGICLGEEPSRSTTIKLLEEAKKRNIKTSFDLNLRLEYFGWRPGVYEATIKAISLADIIFASAKEELLPLTETTNTDAALNKLSKLYNSNSKQTIICRNGGKPAIIFINGLKFLSPCFDVDIVDSLGAGDAFNAGFIAASISNKAIDDALLYAHAAAGFNLTQKGARGMPNKDQLLKFISENKRKQV